MDTAGPQSVCVCQIEEKCTESARHCYRGNMLTNVCTGQQGTVQHCTHNIMNILSCRTTIWSKRSSMWRESEGTTFLRSAADYSSTWMLSAAQQKIAEKHGVLIRLMKAIRTSDQKLIWTDGGRSSTIRRELGVEPLLLHIERSQLRWFLWLGCLLGGGPGSEPEPRGNIYPIQPGNAVGSSRRSWRGMSGFLSWTCWFCEVPSDKRKITDGWIFQPSCELIYVYTIQSCSVSDV